MRKKKERREGGREGGRVEVNMGGGRRKDVRNEDGGGREDGEGRERGGAVWVSGQR